MKKNYGTIAQEIMSGRIKKAKQIVPQMTVTVPSNKAFEVAFKNAKVSKTFLARYYLRAIEIFKRNELNPEYGGIDDPLNYNLEHIMPISIDENWDIDPEIASAYQKRLGNMVLLNPNQNTKLGNASFDDKKIEFNTSTLLTTQEVAKYSGWGPDEINERQDDLASVVSEIWPIKI